MNEDFPRAYKLGAQDFFGRDFIVSSDVLIPRPETEAAVELVLKLAGKPFFPGVNKARSKLPQKPRILDVGTGSGIIALTLKMELPEAEIWASDISEKALKIARKNAEKFGIEKKVKFIKSNLLEFLLSAEQTSAKNVEKFDVVVANLPYVDRDWGWLKDRESAALKFEPEEALYANNGGLELIYKLIEQVHGRAKWLVLEADPIQHEKITSRAEARGCKLEEVRGYQLLFRVFGESEI